MKLIAVYARVSTSKQEEDGTIETQLSVVREFAQKNDFTIVKEYIDEGWSGMVIVRPALDQLRIDAKKKDWEAVLMYDPDRLARTGAWQEVVTEELKEQNIDMLFVTVPKAKSSEDVIMNKMRGVFAEYERMKIIERFRLGKVRKVKEGHLLLSEPAYGYRYIKKNDKVHGYYEINEQEAGVVKMIFSMVANDGMTIRAVVKKLHGLAIPPRRSKKGVWNTSTLGHLLRNGVYIGEAHWGKSEGIVPTKPFKYQKYKKLKKTSRRDRPKEEWFIIPVPPIIDRDLFSRTQMQLKENFNLAWRNKKNEYLLAGKIYCVCGHRRTGEGPQNGRYMYYRCSDRVTCYPLPPSCLQKGINAKIADHLVWKKVIELMTSPDLMEDQVGRWEASRHAPSVSVVDDCEVIVKRLEKLKLEEDRYNKAYGMGLFSIEQLKEYTLSIKEQIIGLNGQLTQINQKEKDVDITSLPNDDEIHNFAIEAKEALKYLNFDVKQGIVRNVIEKIVASVEELKVYGYIPVNTHVEFQTIHRYRRIA